MIPKTKITSQQALYKLDDVAPLMAYPPPDNYTTLPPPTKKRYISIYIYVGLVTFAHFRRQGEDLAEKGALGEWVGVFIFIYFFLFKVIISYGLKVKLF